MKEDYRITVYQRKTWALRTYAVVKYGTDELYYKIDRGDYQKAVDILHASNATAGGVDGPENVRDELP